ncbi:hypothetical protein E2542_SST30565 [Spatholobus suberectus]|nr:hypothetical protein E2542_SST30565 [Spatholobus suberectus]
MPSELSTTSGQSSPPADGDKHKHLTEKLGRCNFQAINNSIMLGGSHQAMTPVCIGYSDFTDQPPHGRTKG